MKQVTMLSLVGLLFAATVAVSATAAAAPARVRAGKTSATKPADLNAALRAVLDVERHTRAYYRTVLARHRPFHPFGVVYRAEREHEAALLEEFARRGIATPEDRWQGKEIEVPDDRTAALEQAEGLEKKTVAAYDKALAKATGDVKQTLERLRAESRDHQRWFADPELCPRGGGGGGGRGPVGRGSS